MKKHTINSQPILTRGKIVKFKIANDRYGVYAADEINWITDESNPKAPTSGIIKEYEILK